MPTYKNVSNQIITVGNVTLSPHREIQVTNQYINPDIKGIVKVSDEPKLKDNFILVLPNQSSPSNMSIFFDHNRSIVLHIKDNTGAPTATKAKITAFVGITDKPEDLIPIHVFEFEKKTYKDNKGQSVSLWSANNSNKLPQGIINPFYELVCFAVTEVSGGSIDVYVKHY